MKLFSHNKNAITLNRNIRKRNSDLNENLPNIPEQNGKLSRRNANQAFFPGKLMLVYSGQCTHKIFITFQTKREILSRREIAI